MINKVEITRFRGIQSLKLDDVRMLTVIGGKNNCSKTSILEALSMLYDNKNPIMFAKISAGRGINIISMETDFIFAPFFYQFDMSNPIKIEINKNSKSTNRSLNISIDRKYKSNVQIPNINFQNNFGIATEALKFEYLKDSKAFEESYISLVPQGFNYDIKKDINALKVSTSFYPARSPNNYEEDTVKLGKLDVEYLLNDVVEILNVIVPSLKSISLVRIGNSSMIYADIGKNKKVPLSNMGDGVSRLLTIALGIASAKNGIIFIDEIENGLHYSVIENVWLGIAKASKKFNCQIICTTHSHEFLSYVNSSNINNNIEDFMYIRLNAKDDFIEGKYFDRELLDIAIKNDMEIR